MASKAEEKRSCLEDLVEAISREGEAVAGFGEVILRVAYHGGLPRQIDVLERHPTYRIGKGLPPLTRRAAGGTIPATE